MIYTYYVMAPQGVSKRTRRAVVSSVRRRTAPTHYLAAHEIQFTVGISVTCPGSIRITAQNTRVESPFAPFSTTGVIDPCVVGNYSSRVQYSTVLVV